MPKISIVIPNWNGEEKLPRHIPNVLAAAKQGKVVEVIVVDDASTDQSVSILKKSFPEVTLITKNTNSGFSSTVNLGVKHAKGDLVVLINNDASPDINFLDYVIPHFKEEKVFSVGCNVGGLWATIRFENGYFWHSQGKDLGKKEDFHKTAWASGGSGVFRKEIWDELGGMDTLYNPFYEEDVDLGYRAMKRGYVNIWESRSKVEHYKEEGVISTHFRKDKINQISQRNQLIFIWKNITDKKLISEHKKALLDMVLKHPKYAMVVTAAFSKFNQILKKRKIEAREQKLTDEEVFAQFTF